MAKEIFIKNVLNVEVDGLRGTNRYIVRAMYDVEKVHPLHGSYYDITQRVVEDITYTWDEIEQEGGIAEIEKQLKECYNV